MEYSFNEKKCRQKNKNIFKQDTHINCERNSFQNLLRIEEV